MSVEAVPLNSFEIKILWSGCIGYIIATVVTVILFYQLLHSYIRTFHTASSDATPDDIQPITKKAKIPYVLVMIYLISTFITCIVFLSIETNVLTGYNHIFTTPRCWTAFILWPFSAGINYILLSITFLHRTYIVFKDSAYEYKSCVYKAFLCFIIFPFPISFFAIYLPIFLDADNLKPMSAYDASTNLACCVFEGVEGWRWFAMKILIASDVLLQTSTIIGLSSLFVRGLWRLNRILMADFLKDNNSKTKSKSTHSSQGSDITRTNSVSASTDINEVVVSVESVLDSWNRQSTIARNQLRPEVQRIMELHNVIKKQAILVFIAITSTIILFVGTCIEIVISLEAGWIIIINSICVWMMLDTSGTYWNICRKYGLCLCCYWKTNKIGM